MEDTGTDDISTMYTHWTYEVINGKCIMLLEMCLLLEPTMVQLYTNNGRSTSWEDIQRRTNTVMRCLYWITMRCSFIKFNTSPISIVSLPLVYDSLPSNNLCPIFMAENYSSCFIIKTKYIVCSASFLEESPTNSSFMTSLSITSTLNRLLAINPLVDKLLLISFTSINFIL